MSELGEKLKARAEQIEIESIDPHSGVNLTRADLLAFAAEVLREFVTTHRESLEWDLEAEVLAHDLEET